MLRLYAGPYTHAISALAGMRAWWSDKPPNHPLERTMFQVSLLSIEPDIEKLPLSPTLKEEFDRLMKYSDLVEDTPEGKSTLGTYLQAFLSNLESAMDNIVFLIVDERRQELYEQTEPLFGQEVADKFGDASRDIAAAGRCIALEEWDAVVFHLMRVLEAGLNALAAELGMPFTRRNWGTIIERIETELRKRSKAGPGPKAKAASKKAWKADLEFYSEAALQFTYFKDAWRNRTAHKGTVYTEEKAESIFQHVCEFMRHLGTKLHE